MGNFANIVNALRASGKFTDTQILDAFMEAETIAGNPMILSMANVSLKEKIKNLLDDVRMPPASKGYELWVEALEMYIESGKSLGIGEIYNKLAERDKKATYSNVSQNMATSVKMALSRCTRIDGERIFGRTVYSISQNDGLTNKEFLACIANKL